MMQNRFDENFFEINAGPVGDLHYQYLTAYVYYANELYRFYRLRFDYFFNIYGENFRSRFEALQSNSYFQMIEFFSRWPALEDNVDFDSIVINLMDFYEGIHSFQLVINPQTVFNDSVRRHGG